MTEKLTIKQAKEGALLSRNEARDLVHTYYMHQKHRIALGNQIFQLKKADRPAQIIEFFFERFQQNESDMIRVLNNYAKNSQVGRWALAQKGIGPILAAGLLAHIDMAKVNSVSSIWRFAGLDPTCVWNKGEKRPWNGELKTLCWKIGESFVKVSGYDDAFYGKLYIERKDWEHEKNDAGGNREYAANYLNTKNIQSKELREALEAGKLTPGHLHSRAKRWTVSIFLSHWFEVAYREFHGEAPPRPYIIEHGGHVDYIRAPAGGDYS